MQWHQGLQRLCFKNTHASDNLCLMMVVALAGSPMGKSELLCLFFASVFLVEGLVLLVVCRPGEDYLLVSCEV